MADAKKSSDDTKSLLVKPSPTHGDPTAYVAVRVTFNTEAKMKLEGEWRFVIILQSSEKDAPAYNLWGIWNFYPEYWGKTNISHNSLSVLDGSGVRSTKLIPKDLSVCPDYYEPWGSGMMRSGDIVAISVTNGNRLGVWLNGQPMCNSKFTEWVFGKTNVDESAKKVGQVFELSPVSIGERFSITLARKPEVSPLSIEMVDGWSPEVHYKYAQTNAK